MDISYLKSNIRRLLISGGHISFFVILREYSQALPRGLFILLKIPAALAAGKTQVNTNIYENECIFFLYKVEKLW